MRKSRLTSLLLILPLLAACSGKPKPPATPTAPVVAPVSTPLDLTKVKDSRELDLEELVPALEAYLNKGSGTPAEKLQRLYDIWQMKPRQDGGMPVKLIAEGDLDGDGIAETIISLNTKRADRPDTLGRMAVIYRKESRWAIDNGPDESLGANGDQGRNVYLSDVKDLTADGKPEIIWFSEDHGAHTGYAYVYISSWQPGRFERLPGTPMYITFPELRVEGSDIVLHGGTVGSAGAGVLQRAHIDRYRWTDRAFKLIDVRYDTSDFTYHRLQDGVVAEQYGRMTDALAAYRDALTPPSGKPMEQGVPPEWHARFQEAVPAFARFRLAVLLLKQGDAAGANTTAGKATGAYAGLAQTVQGATTRDAACIAGTDWSGNHPELFEALHSPFGYNNNRFSVCGPMLPPG